ncbi:MAG: hypothetical protein RR324_09915 [Cellulosilyticaceae bacterium]
MKFENIIRNLKKDGYKVEPMEFCFQTCLGVQGTALIDIVDEDIVPTTARYVDVINQIENNKSHILTITIDYGCTKKRLSDYLRL